MLAIRFKRIGKKNRPSYRVVVAEHRFATNGRFVADLGFYNPHTKESSLKTDEIKQWLDKGARPSNSVAKLLHKNKVKHDLVVIVQRRKAPKIKREIESKATSSVSNNVVAGSDSETSGSTVAETAPPHAETPINDEATEKSSAEDRSAEVDTENQ